MYQEEYQELLSLTRTLCAMFGPSGYEDEVREFILQAAMPYADQIETDAMGNLMVLRKGKKRTERPVMVCAHMDEVGVIAKRFTEEGMVKFGFIGGVDPRVVIGKRVQFRTEAGETVEGVIGFKAVHLTTPAERSQAPKIKDLYIDIGCTSKEQAEKKLSLGDYGTFAPEIVAFGDGFLKAKALDDRLGCAVMLMLMRRQPEVDTWFSFHVQEEPGLRGAGSTTFLIRPAFCLVVEGTTAADLAEAPEHKQVCALRKGAVLPFMDNRTIYDAALFEMLRDACEARGIPWQTKQMIAGGTDAGQIHKSIDGVRSVGVAAPLRYIHSPSSVAAESDIIAVYRTAQAFLEEIGGDANV
ncbi:MAG: M42 family metallopeptidase [Butyricicoccus sp.]|nr:M42 family peptidase [Butyricicoccus pullicaecorum]